MADSEHGTRRAVGMKSKTTGIVFKAGDEEQYRPQVEYIGQWITARLDGSGLMVKCMAEARYGDRTVVIEVPIGKHDFADIEREMREAAENMAGAARVESERAAMQAYMAAVSRKEAI